MALKQWRMKNGEWVEIANMSDSHIEACLALLKRKGYIGASTLAFYLSCPEPNGDMASLEFDRECDEVFNAKVHPCYDELEAELKRRRTMRAVDMASPSVNGAVLHNQSFGKQGGVA